MPSGSINYSTVKYTNLEVVFFLISVFDFSHEVNRKYIHPISESFNLVSNVWYVEIMMKSVIDDTYEDALTMILQR